MSENKTVNSTSPSDWSTFLTFTPPPLPPGYSKHHLVVLEECHCPLPEFPFPHTYTGYGNTSPEQVAERIREATIVIATIVPVTGADLAQAPNLQCLAIMATGMGWLDRGAFAARVPWVAVVNCPQSNIPAVTEHWLGLYLAARKKVVEMHRLTTETREWEATGTLTTKWGPAGPPLAMGQEVLGVVGFGALGSRIKQLAEAVGFGEVVVAERKGRTEVRPGRMAFDQVLRQATVIVITCPRDESTVDLIHEPELRAMRPETCVVNMARGGIVNEAALARALRESWISCAATDVFDLEPGGMGTSPLLPRLDQGESPVPNLTVSPHVSWYSGRTVEMLHQLLLEGICGFVQGNIIKRNVVVLDGKIYK